MQVRNVLDSGVALAALLTLLLFAVAVHAEPERVPRAWPGTGVGHKLDSGALGVPQLGLSMPLFDVVEGEVMAGIGLNAAGDAAEVVNRFSFGLRWFWPEAGALHVDEPVRPFLWTALHHGHKVLVSDAMKNPVGATLTSTDAGVRHLTGAEGGVGVLLALPVDGVNWPVMLRFATAWLPAFVHAEGDGAARDDILLLVDLAVGLPLSFESL